MPTEFIVPPSNAQGYGRDADFRAYMERIIHGIPGVQDGIQPGDTIQLHEKDIPAVQQVLEALDKTGINLVLRDTQPEPLPGPQP